MWRLRGGFPFTLYKETGVQTPKSPIKGNQSSCFMSVALEKQEPTHAQAASRFETFPKWAKRAGRVCPPQNKTWAGLKGPLDIPLLVSCTFSVCSLEVPTLEFWGSELWNSRVLQRSSQPKL